MILNYRSFSDFNSPGSSGHDPIDLGFRVIIYCSTRPCTKKPHSKAHAINPELHESYLEYHDT